MPEPRLPHMSFLAARMVSRPGVSTIHRFYDTSPISPSGKLIATTELPFENRLPLRGDMAHVVVREIDGGREVWRGSTEAWDTQVGAHAQWGRTDDVLLYNVLGADGWSHGVSVNPETGSVHSLSGDVYVADPLGDLILAPNLRRIGEVQPGYGVGYLSTARLSTPHALADDGVYATSLRSDKRELLMSFEAIVEALGGKFKRMASSGRFYGFHVKWNPQGTRVMFLLRWLGDGAQRVSRNYMITFRRDGSDIRLALDADRWRFGHHPNWCEDGEHIVMNLLPIPASPRLAPVHDLLQRATRRLRVRWRPPGFRLRFCRFRCDGTDFKVLCPSVEGSGHPSMGAGDRTVLTDAYVTEAVAFADGTVPIRLAGVHSGRVVTLLRLLARPEFPGPRLEWRVDPHPAWDVHRTRFTINAMQQGRRGVFVVDVPPEVFAEVT